MPRPLVFGNGRLLVQLDNKGRIRDFFWPEVGIRNHVAGHYHHFGIYVDGKFSWTEWKEWVVTQRYLPRSLIGVTTFECASLGLVIEAEDQVVAYMPLGVAHPTGHDAFIRNLSITNLTDRPRQVELFFSQDFRIAESEIGETAMYRPDINAMVHYKWKYHFLCSGRSDMGGIHQKTVGLRGINGLEGTWRDAEDGRLHEKPIEQGAVDSTFSILVACPSRGSAWAEYKIECCGEMPNLNYKSESVPIPPTYIEARFDALPKEVAQLASLGAQILTTQISWIGWILAANDSDIMQGNRSTYSYVWPRDGALVADVLRRLGDDVMCGGYHARMFQTISEAQPFFLQKYDANGCFGSTWHPWFFDGEPEVPLQEDETALSLWSLERHGLPLFRKNKEISKLEKILYIVAPENIQHAAAFLIQYIDSSTGLPKPSYDLWEERRGIHTFTVATVIAGLLSSSVMLADIDKHLSAEALTTAEVIRQALLEHLVDSQTGCFVRGLRSLTRTKLEPDYAPDASLLLVGRYAGLPPDHPVVKATNEWIEKELWVHSPIGGLARYPNDYYARVCDQYPGNPWVITTMWLAQEKIRAAKSVKDLDEPLRLLNWVCDRAETTGVLGEQFHPETGEVLTVSPLTWSHAEFIAACLDWCEKYRELVSGPIPKT
jgi:GH15 family glucan-1,4-alpha-glucosidase